MVRNFDMTSDWLSLVLGKFGMTSDFRLDRKIV